MPKRKYEDLRSQDEIAKDGENGVEKLTDGQEQPSKALTSNRSLRKSSVLVLCSRGITHRHRILTKDLMALLPHSKKDVKLAPKESRRETLLEICDLRSSDKCMFFDARRNQTLFLWIFKAPYGPTVLFHVLNVHTTGELKMLGNCLKGSRALLSFDQNFEESPKNKIIKQLLWETFAVPQQHKRGKPFVDHVFSFSLIDDKVWFRNFQIQYDTGDNGKGGLEGTGGTELVEIGPRFVLEVAKIFTGVMGGSVVYSNDSISLPETLKQLRNKRKADKQKRRKLDKDNRVEMLEELKPEQDEIEDVFRE